MAASNTNTSVGGGSRLQVLGVNQLQTSIDNLTSAVQSLTQRMGGGSAASVPAAPPTLNQTAAGGNGTSFASAAGTYVPPAAGTYNSAAGTYTPPPVRGGGPPTMNQQSSGGNGGWGGTALGAFTGAAAGARAVIGSPLMTSIASQGSSMLGGMSAMSSYLQAGAFYGGSAAGMTGQLRTLNDVASNANDLTQGLGILAYGSGAWGTRNALYNGMSGAANMLGVLNPALGYAGAAKMGQQLYSQQMSMNMLSMGYGLTPRTMAGGTNSIQAVNQAILQRTFGGSSVNQKNFNAAAAPGGTLWYNLSALGLSGQNLTSMEQMLSAQNTLAGKGYTNNQINQLFAGVAHGNKNSVSQLQSVFGKNATSIIQTLKDKTALSTQRSGEEEQGYQSGLAKSVQLLNQFNAALNKLMSGSLGKATGYAHGFTTGNGNSPSSWMEQGIAAGPLGIVGNLFGVPHVNIGGGAAATAPAANLSGMGPSNTSSSSSMSAQANGSPGSRTGNGKGGSSKINNGVSGAARGAVGWAETQLGVPYLWGGEQPGVGFDCSGLMQWSYGKAGVKLPRTSQQQWAALGRSHSIPLDQVQAGDLIFTAGSDGTADAPGHVAMMINNRTLIQAEETGTNIMFTPYNPKEWQHAARPTGPGVAGTGPGAGGSGSSGTLTASGMGGASGFGGYTEGGGMGSTEEIDAISGGGGGYMSGFLGNTGYSGSSGRGNPGGSGGSGPPAPKTVSGDVALGKKMAAAKGWTGNQWNDLYDLWMKESSWKWNAQNPSSGAYGIPQALPGSKMASAGSDWRTDAGTQIKWGLGYIEDRYKNPAGAWAHEKQFNWYAGGTQNAAKGLMVVGEDGPEVIDNRSGGQSIMTAGQTSGLLSGLRSGQYGAPSGGVTIQVSVGDINLNGGGLTGSSDVSNAAREIGTQIAEVIEQNEMIRRLASGVSY